MSIAYKYHDRVAYTNNTAPWITYEIRKHSRIGGLYSVEAREAGVLLAGYTRAHTVDDFGNLVPIVNNDQVSFSLRDGGNDTCYIRASDMH